MKGGNRHGGFTIVETLIVVAVTGALFTSALVMISGQQSRTEFNQGVREVHSQIQDILNDVSTGYYNNPGGFSCTSATGANSAPNIQTLAGNDNQGGNYNCTFIGKVLHFNPGGNNAGVYNQYVVVGRQYKPSSNDPVASLTDALPVAMALTNQGGGSNFEGRLQTIIPYGLTVTKLQYVSGGAAHNIGAFGLFSRLAQQQSSTSGTEPVDLIPVPGTDMSSNSSQDIVVDEINHLRNDGSTSVVTGRNPGDSAPINPDGGVQIYVMVPNGDKCGVITIGGTGNGQLDSKLDIFDVSSNRC